MPRNCVKLILSLMLVILGELCYPLGVTPLTDFRVSRYLGNWYEIARLPNRLQNECLPPIRASYAIDQLDSRRIIVENVCNTKDKHLHSIAGVAYFEDSNSVAKLKVTFVPKFFRWLQLGYGDYWILYTDYDKVAVVGSPNREYLWLLARIPNLSHDDLLAAIAIAKQQGFDTSKLIYNYPRVRLTANI